MRAQSSSRTRLWTRSAQVKRRSGNPHRRIDAQCSIPATLTEGSWRVWLRRRLYWLRCRIVNENGTQGPFPPPRTARPRPKCHPGCGLRPVVARRRARLFGAQARGQHRRRPHDRAASFRLQGRAVAAHRGPIGCTGNIFHIKQQSIGRIAILRKAKLVVVDTGWCGVVGGILVFNASSNLERQAGPEKKISCSRSYRPSPGCCNRLS